MEITNQQIFSFLQSSLPDNNETHEFMRYLTLGVIKKHITIIYQLDPTETFIIGVLFYRKTDKAIKIEVFYYDEKYRNHGLGSITISQLLREKTDLYVTIDKSNTEYLQFMIRKGFDIYQVQENEYRLIRKKQKPHEVRLYN